MDFSLSGSRNLQDFGVRRVTSSSMLVPTEFPDAQGNSLFFGDYTGLSAVDDAHPLWMDTRSPDLVLCPGTGVPGVPPRVCTFTSAPNGPMANDDPERDGPASHRENEESQANVPERYVVGVSREGYLVKSKGSLCPLPDDGFCHSARL